MNVQVGLWMCHHNQLWHVNAAKLSGGNSRHAPMVMPPTMGWKPIKEAAQLESRLRVCAPHCKKGPSKQLPLPGAQIETKDGYKKTTQIWGLNDGNQHRNTREA
uniref:Uncharacterized protein n=1 Tax=Amphimedon queenslandica TaxID=400682 RepID=A0A1X7UAA2_AMPQE